MRRNDHFIGVDYYVRNDENEKSRNRIKGRKKFIFIHQRKDSLDEVYFGRVKCF